MKLNKLLIFLYPIFLGLPDLAIDLSVINLRIDDIIMYLLFLLNIKLILTTTVYQKKPPFYRFIKVLLIWFVFSLFIALISGNELSVYEISRSVGSIPYLLVLPLLIENIEYRKYLFYGAIFGLAVFLYGIYTNYSAMNLAFSTFEKSHELKSSLSFLTLNPNAISFIGVIFSLLLFLGYFSFNKKVFLMLGIMALSIPFFTFSRGMSVGMTIAIFTFFLLRKTNIYVKVIAVFFLCFLIFNVVNTSSDLVKNATNINISTGAGFSNRYQLWGEALELIEKSPVFGSGFSTTEYMYKIYFKGHMSHNILLHYGVELGIIGVFLFLLMVYYILKDRLKRFRISKNDYYLLQFAFFIGIVVSDMSSQDLYFNKYAILIFTLCSCNYIELNITNKQ